VSFPVLIDDEEMAVIGHGCCLMIPVDPGDHTIRITALGYKDNPLEITTEEGNHFSRWSLQRAQMSLLPS
jgi:hypothetical protein